MVEAFADRMVLNDARTGTKNASSTDTRHPSASPSFHTQVYQFHILYRCYVRAELSLGLSRTTMTRKRDSMAEPSSVKRRRLTDNITSESQSPARLTESKTAELLRWMDKADKGDGPVFEVSSPRLRKGAKIPSDVTERPLILDGRTYLNARWTIKPMEKWLSMTKYKKLYVWNQESRIDSC